MSSRMSPNTGCAPRSTKALTQETKVNEGRITSSPGSMFSSRAHISSASVQDGVNSTSGTHSALFQQIAAAPREAAIARRVHRLDGLADVLQLVADDERAVKGDSVWIGDGEDEHSLVSRRDAARAAQV